MKKLAGIILALILIFSIGTTGVFAASGRGQGKGSCRVASNSACEFIDSNKDGTCDNYHSGGTRLHGGVGRKAGRSSGNGCHRV